MESNNDFTFVYFLHIKINNGNFKLATMQPMKYNSIKIRLIHFIEFKFGLKYTDR